MPEEVIKTKDKEIKVPVKQRSSTFSPPLKYKIVADDHINLTKAKAYEFLELKTFEGERAVRERHVQFLFDEWSANRFLWQNIIIASSKVAGSDVEYRINGQHTCWMRVNVPERYEPLDCKVRCMTYMVANDEQLRTLYSVFDRGAPRTQGHIGNVLLMGSPCSGGIPHNRIGGLISGFKLYWSEVRNPPRMSINDWCGIIENNYSVIFNTVGRWYSERAWNLGFMRRAAIVAAMMFTFEKNVGSSDEFWGRVCDGIGLTSKTDARYKLREYLLTHGHAAEKGPIAKVGQEEMLCVCLNMWNHWRSEEPVTVVKSVMERPKIQS